MRTSQLPFAISILALSFVASSCASANEFNDRAPTSQLDKEHAWVRSSHVQLDVARANLALLSAKSAYIVDGSPEDSIMQLNKAENYLGEALDNASSDTKSRILFLRAQIAQARGSVSAQSPEAEQDLNLVVSESEALLAEALAESQFRLVERQQDASARLAIARARAELLTAQSAYEAESAKQDVISNLDRAEQRLVDAKNDASSWTRAEIEAFQSDLRDVKSMIEANADAAGAKLDELADDMKAKLDKMEQDVANSDEAEWVRTQYAQIEAQAALHRAELAERADETKEQVAGHLEDARNWLQRTERSASGETKALWADLEGRVEQTREDITKGRKNVQNSIADLLDRAADAVRAEEQSADENTKDEEKN